MALFDRRGEGERAPQPTARTPLARAADDPSVQQLQKRVEACREQMSRVGDQLAAAMAKERAAEESALEAASRGEDRSSALHDAHERVVALQKVNAMAENGLQRAEAERSRALAVARTNLSSQYVGRIVDLLDEQEDLLWRVLETQQAIDGLTAIAFEDGVPIGIHPRMYWSIGFPGFPFVRTAGEIMTWLRHRSIAPRSSARRNGGRS